MVYTRKFDVSTFAWKFKAAMVVDKIREAGKLDELQKAIERKFDCECDTASDHEIDDFVGKNEVKILEICGLDADGKPLSKKKKFKVFMRVTGVTSEDVEADNPEEAAELAVDEFFDRSTDPFAMIDREDFETAVPINYEVDDDGDTKMFKSLKEDGRAVEESVSEKRNSLVGAELWALVKIERESSGYYGTPYVSLFISEELAKAAMKNQYDVELRWFDNEDKLSMYQPPDEGGNTCYLIGSDKTSVAMHVCKVEAVPN